MNAVEINFVVDTIGIFIFANIESQFARNAFLLCIWHHISVVLLVSFLFVSFSICNLVFFFKYICCVFLFNSCDPFYSFVLRGKEVLFEFRPYCNRFQFECVFFFNPSFIHLLTFASQILILINFNYFAWMYHVILLFLSIWFSAWI